MYAIKNRKLKNSEQFANWFINRFQNNPKNKYLLNYINKRYRKAFYLACNQLINNHTANKKFKSHFFDHEDIYNELYIQVINRLSKYERKQKLKFNTIIINMIKFSQLDLKRQIEKYINKYESVSHMRDFYIKSESNVSKFNFMRDIAPTKIQNSINIMLDGISRHRNYFDKYFSIMSGHKKAKRQRQRDIIESIKYIENSLNI